MLAFASAAAVAGLAKADAPAATASDASAPSKASRRSETSAPPEAPAPPTAPDVSRWWHEVEPSASFAVSYLFNGLGPGPGIAPAAENGPLSSPFHPEHNSFQLDEAALALRKPTTGANTAGFAIEVSYGKTAGVVGNSDGAGPVPVNGGNDFWLSEANISWETPWKMTLTAGKFLTHIGYEVASASRNPFVTRGFVYQALQPVDQIGIKLSGECDCGVSWMLGATNGFTPNASDIDDEKDFVWSFAYHWERASVAFQGEWGHDAESAGFGGPGRREDDTQLILELLAEARPDEKNRAFLDVTFREIAAGGLGRPWALGAVLGGHRMLSDRFQGSLRFEFAHADNDGTSFVATAPAAIAGQPANFLAPGFAATRLGAVGVTTTVELALTGGLVARLEGKYESVVYARDGSEQVFNPPRGGAPRDDDQFLAALQLVYSF